MNFPLICVLDFEASCDDNVQYFDNEIIEFPSVLLQFDNDTCCYNIVSEFKQYCKPLFKPIVPKFTTELTGITQEQIDNGGNFPDVLDDHYKWLNGFGQDEQIMFVTCGNSDLKTFMVNECKKWNIIPYGIYQKYINICKIFGDFYKPENNKKDYGMIRMLEYLGIELKGKQHCGLDDCHNTAKIFQRIISDGYIIPDNFINTIDIKDYKIAHPNSKKELERNKKRLERLKETK